MKTKILIIDESDLVRAGLKSVFGRAKDVEVVAEVRDGKSAVHLATDTVELNLVVLDVKLNAKPDLELLQRIKKKRPELPVLLYCLSATAHVVEQARALGASGVVFKGGCPEDLVRAVRVVSEGHALWGESGC